MQIVRRTGAALAVLALTLFAAASAFAQSTDLYPASDTIAMGSAPMLIGGLVPCTFHGGSVVAPAKGSTGAVTLKYREKPSFECSGGYSVEVLGEWNISFEYGTATGKITVPPSGFTLRSSKKEIVFCDTEGPFTLNVGWNNGFSSPVSVGSQMEVYGSPELFWPSISKYAPVSFGPSLVSLTDTTHPASMPVLGP